MPTAFDLEAERIKAASRPEDLFGRLDGPPDETLRALKDEHRRVLLIIAPDINGETDVSTAATQRFIELYEAAMRVVEAPPVVVTSRRQVYRVGPVIAQGDLADIYACTFGDDAQPGLLKLARNAGDNDLLEAEAEGVRYLREADRPEAATFLPYLPEPIDSFTYAEDGAAARRANVFRYEPGLIGFTEAHKAYPSGINPRDAAWIWRRLLLLLGYVHARGVVHGAVLPPHVLIHPDHGLVLTDWCYAVRDPALSGAHIPAISTEYEAWYPPEVLNRDLPGPAVDILMAARCLVYLLGGEPVTGQLSDFVPAPLRAFFAGCVRPSAKLVPDNAWRLRAEFTDVVERLWGKRTYHPFVMPTQ